MRRLYVGLFLVVLFSAVGVFAQSDPNFEQGIRLFGSYEGGNIDQISTATGGLVVRIPLVSYPQRGGALKLSFSLFYTGKAWRVHSHYDTTLGTTLYNWVLPTGIIPPVLGVSIIQDGAFGQTYDKSVDSGTGKAYYQYSIQESDGSRHVLGATSSGDESIDGSGYSGSTDKAGIKAVSETGPSGYGTGYQDPNGNLISTVGTDTMGRPFPAGVSTSDFSNCPVNTVSAVVWSFPSFGGNTAPVKLCSVNVSYQTSFNAYNISEASGTTPLVTTAVLPDGTTFQFSYNNNLDLDGIIFPTGARISYIWQNLSICEYAWPGVSRAVATRTIDDGTGGRTWTYTWGSAVNTTWAVVVTDPAGDDTVHTLTAIPANISTCSYYETEAQYFQGSHSAGALLRTVDTAYTSAGENPYDSYFDGQFTSYGVMPTSVTTTLNDVNPVQISQTLFKYDSGATFYDQNSPVTTYYPLTYGSLLEQDDYDYGTASAPGALLRSTTNAYEWQQNGNYLAANLLDRVASVTILPVDTTGKPSAQTIYGYDEANGSPQCVCGNQTSVTRVLNAGTQPQATRIVYNSDGTVASTYDSKNNQTSFGYGAGYAGSGPVTTINALGQQTIRGYDFNTGLLTQLQDPNDIAAGRAGTTYAYDGMWRPTQVTYPPDNGGLQPVTAYSYPDQVTTEVQRKIDGSRWTTTYIRTDGLKRETRRATANDESTTWDEVDTCYDALGRKGFVSYPYGNPPGFSASPVCSGAGDAYGYDALSRVKTVMHSDGSQIVTQYQGRAVSVTDEAGVQRITQTDSLGRLRDVCEVSGSTLKGPGGTSGPCNLDFGGSGFLTAYSYDALGNLTGVSQNGLAPRGFVYDSLSRLTSASNPESGTTSYSYSNGNSLCSGNDSDVCTRSDDRGVITTYAYNDPLNRLTAKSYTGLATPSVFFTYDTAPTGWTLHNAIGRVTSKGTSGTATEELLDYDALGRVVRDYQCTPTNCAGTPYELDYGYDLISDITSETGAGVTLTSAFNVAGRQTSTTSNLSDASHPANLLSLAHYNAYGSLVSATFGNGTTEVSHYTPRGWAQDRSIIAPGTPKPGAASETVNAVTGDGSDQSTQTQTQAATGSSSYITIIGSAVEHRVWDPECNCFFFAWNSGTVYVQIGGYVGSVDYVMGGSDSAASLASSLASSLNGDPNSPVTAWSSSNVVYINSRATGAATNYALTTWSTYDSSVGFTRPAFWATFPNGGTSYSMTGGQDAQYGTIYDSGSVWMNVNGFQVSVGYGQGSTTSSVASALVSALNGSGSPVSASASGSAITLTATTTGATTDYTVTAGSSTNQPGTFGQPSFSVPTANLAGGSDGTSIYSFSANYIPNGNVQTVADMANSNWTYVYDEFNRLKTAVSTGGSGCAYVYDRFGNRWQQNTYNGSCSTPTYTFNGGNNRIDGASYDAAGNLLNDGSHNYAYDAENRIVSVDGGGATYVYDADGRRVSKTVSGVTTDYVYDLGGHAIIEAGALKEIYAAGRHLATYANGTTYFNHSDWLGTERARSNMSGQSCELIASFPFGDNQTVSPGGGGNCGDPSTRHFTGKERDGESNLDYFGARYYGSAMGRFVTPDWAAVPTDVPYAHFGNPQSLNLYSYVQNNPTTVGDPDGHDGPGSAVAEPEVAEETVGEVLEELAPEAVEAGAEGSTLGPVGVVVGVTVVAVGVGDYEYRKHFSDPGAPPPPSTPKPPATVASPQMAHNKDPRRSTKDDHQRGVSRKNRDRGGEKGDKAREKKGMFPRKRPSGYPKKGPWPPKPPKPNDPPPPPPPPKNDD